MKAQITVLRKDIYLVPACGITAHPMMLTTNKDIRSKEDVIKTARLHFPGWKTREYFHCEK